MPIFRGTVGDGYILLIGERLLSAILAYTPAPLLTRKGGSRYPCVHNFHVGLCA